MLSTCRAPSPPPLPEGEGERASSVSRQSTSCAEEHPTSRPPCHPEVRRRISRRLRTGREILRCSQNDGTAAGHGQLNHALHKAVLPVGREAEVVVASSGKDRG